MVKERCPECGGAGEIEDCDDILECELCHGEGRWDPENPSGDRTTDD